MKLAHMIDKCVYVCVFSIECLMGTLVISMCYVLLFVPLEGTCGVNLFLFLCGYGFVIF